MSVCSIFFAKKGYSRRPRVPACNPEQPGIAQSPRSCARWGENRESTVRTSAPGRRAPSSSTPIWGTSRYGRELTQPDTVDMICKEMRAPGA